MKAETAGSKTRTAVRRTTADRLLVVGLVYVGYSAGLPGRLNVGFGPITFQLLVATGIGVVGWQRMSSWPVLSQYLRYATAFVVWLMVSSIASWDTGTLSFTATTALWLLFLVPGFACLLREERYRKALFVGVAAAALTLAFTALGRMVTGREIFDLPDPSRSILLGLKRSVANPRLVYVIPFFVANAPRLAPRLRWLAAAAAAGGIVVSGGRTGLLGVAAAILAYALLRKGSSRRLRAMLTVALLGLTFVVAVNEFGGQAAIGKNRLLAYFRGERTTGDEYREAQLERAWHVGLRNPVFGAGYEGLNGVDDFAFNEIRYEPTRRNAMEGSVHNTFAQVFAEFGIPGTITFVLLLYMLLRAGAQARDRPEIRAVTAALVGLVVSMCFDRVALSFEYLPFAYLLGALGDRESASS